MVDLVRRHPLDRGSQRLRLQQIAVHELDLRAQVLGAAERGAPLRVIRGLGRRPAHDARDRVALLEQQLRQERAVLTGDAGDQGASGLSRCRSEGHSESLCALSLARACGPDAGARR